LVRWSEGGDLVALCCEDAFYVLRCDRAAVDAALTSGALDDVDGVEDAFALEGEHAARATTALWVGDCLLFTTSQLTGGAGAGGGSGRLAYWVGGNLVPLAHADRPLYLLGYLAKEDRVFLCDRDRRVVTHKLLRSTLEYQTAVVREDFAAANQILPSVPVSQHDEIARFLESQGFKKLALTVARDPDLRFDLAVELGQLDVARSVMADISRKSEKEIGEIDSDNIGDTGHIPAASEVELKWKRLGDLALARCDLVLAKECIQRAEDVSAQLLLSTCAGDAAGLLETAKSAASRGRTNVAFTAYFLLGRLEECVDLLCEAGRVPEAAFLARTYLPSQVSRMVALWRADLEKVSRRAARSLADPNEFSQLFPDLKLALKAEALFKQRRAQGAVDASIYPRAKGEVDLNLIEVMRKMATGAGVSKSATPALSATIDTVAKEKEPVPETVGATAAGLETQGPAMAQDNTEFEVGTLADVQPAEIQNPPAEVGIDGGRPNELPKEQDEDDLDALLDSEDINGPSVDSGVDDIDLDDFE
jgi:coatomer subunit beta'